MSQPTTPNTDRNGDPIVGDILDIIDKGDSKRYAVAVRVAEYVRSKLSEARREAYEYSKAAIIAGPILSSGRRITGIPGSIPQVRIVSHVTVVAMTTLVHQLGVSPDN